MKKMFLLILSLFFIVTSCQLFGDSDKDTNVKEEVTDHEDTPQNGGGNENPSSPDVEIISQGNIIFSEAGGWFESVFLSWNNLEGISLYSVYYRDVNSEDYIKADTELIRETRVDIPGLLGDTQYYIKVIPLSDIGEEISGESIISVTTKSFDRSGFAFLPSSTYGDASGAYKPEGVLKDGADVIYVTDTTKDSVTLDVAGTVYTGLFNILAARQSDSIDTPLSIRFIGSVTPPDGVVQDDLKLLDVKTTYHITLEGIGSETMLEGWGLNIRNSGDIEVRNLSFYDFPDDSVSIQSDNRNIWIHNNDFMIGKDMGGDKSKGDGSCDIKDNSSFVTVSYNHFMATGKSSLCGMNDTEEFFVTYHHNYFDESSSRHPRVRQGTIHVYNNYFKGQETYGVGAAKYSSIFVQNNYFENCVRPMIIASQGHDMKDLYPGSGDHQSMMSGEDGGSIKATGNYMDTFSSNWFDADADTGDALTGGGVYNNFDSEFSTNSYPYVLDTPENAVTKILVMSGRLETETEEIIEVEQTDLQKVITAKYFIEAALTGIYFTDGAATELEVDTILESVDDNIHTDISVEKSISEVDKTLTILISCGSESEIITVRALTTEEKITHAADLIKDGVSTIEFDNPELTLIEVNEVLTTLSPSFYDGITVISELDSDITITVSFTDGTSDTVTVYAPTDEKRVLDTRTLIENGITNISFTPGNSVEEILEEVHSELTAVEEFYSFGTGVVTEVVDGSITITISCGDSVSIITIEKPSDMDYLTAVIEILTDSEDIRWSEDLETTYSLVSSAIDDISSVSIFGATVTVDEISDGDTSVTVRVEYGGLSDVINLQATTDYLFNVSDWVDTYIKSDGSTTDLGEGTNFYAAECQIDSSLLDKIEFYNTEKKYRVEFTNASITDGNITYNLTHMLELRDSGSDIIFHVTDGSLITFVYDDITSITSYRSLSGITLEAVPGSYTGNNCQVITEAVSGSGSIRLTKNLDTHLLAVIISEFY